jgi:hypothetical protein
VGKARAYFSILRWDAIGLSNFLKLASTCNDDSEISKSLLKGEVYSRLEHMKSYSLG